MSDEDQSGSLFGAISIVGAISLCCIGLGTAIGGAVLIGGVGGLAGAAGADSTTVAVGSASARGALVSLIVTAVTVVVIALVAKWRLQ